MERDGLDTSGNLDKYHKAINQAQAEVRRITGRLKQMGVIPYTERELLAQKLDAVFPDAGTGLEVVWEGKRYIKRAQPLSRSRSGRTVHAWEKWWVCIGDAVRAYAGRIAEQDQLNQLLDAEFPDAVSRSWGTWPVDNK